MSWPWSRHEEIKMSEKSVMAVVLTYGNKILNPASNHIF